MRLHPKMKALCLWVALVGTTRLVALHPRIDAGECLCRAVGREGLTRRSGDQFLFGNRADLARVALERATVLADRHD